MSEFAVYPPPSIAVTPQMLAYAEATADQTGIVAGSVTDITGLTASVTLPAGRRIRIKAFVVASNSTAGGFMELRIYEGATSLQRHYAAPGTANEIVSMEVEIILTPTAGTHTYKVALNPVGTGRTYAATNAPSYLIIEDITGSAWPVGATLGAGMIASEAWTDYVPTMSQVGNVTFNVNSSRYTKIGRTVTWNAAFTVTGTGTAGTGLSLTLPVPSAITSPGPSFGAGSIYDSSVATFYNGSWVPSSTTTIVLLGDWSGPQVWGITPSVGAGSGDFVRVSITYEAAS